jgi:N-acyl-D-aspartate/D-glutamate deacylase
LTSQQEGYWADIVAFNPKTYGPRSNFTNAPQNAEGVEYLLVNGEVVIDKGTWNGNLSGRVLKLKGVSTTN